MKLSEAGADFIRSFEGYHAALPNGDCAAYLDPVGVPTIGWGCTENVRLGMVWTREKAEQEFRKELAQFEAAVNRLVTVEINQNEFDALVSFAYNVGSAGLARSSVLRYLNKNNRKRASESFVLWNKGTIRGRKVVLRGLTRRRLAEASMFMTPVEAFEEMAEEDLPVQKVEPSAEPMSTTTKVTVGAAVGGAAAAGAQTAAPMIPMPPADATTAISAWHSLGSTIQSAATFTAQHWGFALAAVGFYIGVVHVLPWAQKRWAP